MGQLNDFPRSVAETANSSDNLDIALDRRQYQATQNQMIREYAFSYTLDVYLSSSTSSL
ncbi:hypothetical protein [Pseudoxanthomonas dokdonensis]|uniref:hypothetical protein n=1 Tax=Pseudoxanthomonas dokdonensis TaxID=344882 RepID=UPI000A8A8477|nr:hypothetical protein [Pseudoxanthomonas dokdonensis]